MYLKEPYRTTASESPCKRKTLTPDEQVKYLAKDTYTRNLGGGLAGIRLGKSAVTIATKLFAVTPRTR